MTTNQTAAVRAIFSAALTDWARHRGITCHLHPTDVPDLAPPGSVVLASVEESAPGMWTATFRLSVVDDDSTGRHGQSLRAEHLVYLATQMQLMTIGNLVAAPSPEPLTPVRDHPAGEHPRWILELRCTAPIGTMMWAPAHPVVA